MGRLWAAPMLSGPAKLSGGKEVAQERNVIQAEGGAGAGHADRPGGVFRAGQQRAGLAAAGEDADCEGVLIGDRVANRLKTASRQGTS